MENPRIIKSIRRALEEIVPSVETLSAAGFFGVAVNYRGLDDSHGADFCPVVIKPKHAVHERPVEEDAPVHEQRQERRRLWSRLAHNSFVGSRTLFRGWVGTIGFGLLSLFPLITRVLAPRQTGRLVAWLSELFLPEPRTELTLMRHDAAAHAAAEGLLLGFAVQEKAERVASVLRPAGMTDNDAKAYLAFLDAQPQTNRKKKAGVQGYCMGGPLSFRTAAAVPNRIGAVGSFHGGGLTTKNPDRPHLLIPKTHASFLVAVAQNDDKAQPDSKDILKAAFAEAKRPATVEVYPANHGWCVKGSQVYAEASAERAWAELTKLYKASLA